MNVDAMEPMVPEEANEALDDEVLTLVGEAKTLAASIHPTCTVPSATSFDQPIATIRE